jgi:hypothetical protein
MSLNDKINEKVKEAFESLPDDIKNFLNKSTNDDLQNIADLLQGLKIFFIEFKKMKEELSKEPEKSIEEQVFELIEKEINHLIGMGLNKDSFKRNIFQLKNNYPNDFFLKQCLFLAIMKGVHQLIEGDRAYIRWAISDNNNEFWCISFDKKMNEYITDRWNFSYSTALFFFPNYFYFSSKKNVEKAHNILSNFFGINILDWWYKE